MEDVENHFHATLAVRGQTVQIGPTDHHCVCAEGECGHDLRTATEARVYQHGGVVIERGYETWKHFDRCRHLVQLAAAVIGDDDALRAGRHRFGCIGDL